MDVQIYVHCACFLLLHAMFPRGGADAANEMSTVLPPNFVPMIDGTAGKPAVLPEILAAPDAKGQICTLASLEATIVIWPEGDESREVRIEMPDQGVTASTTQNCMSGGSNPSVKPLLVVTWSSSFQLCFYISKDDANWKLDQVVFVFNSSEVPLGVSKSEMRMYGSEASALTELQAPLGFSYRCWAPKNFPLLPLGGIQSAQKDNASLLVNNFQLQPFVDDKKVFGDEIPCREDLIVKRQRRRRDSTVTIAVGSSLAVVAVVTVLGYAIFRHLKIKAVGYDTMQ